MALGFGKAEGEEGLAAAAVDVSVKEESNGEVEGGDDGVARSRISSACN